MKYFVGMIVLLALLLTITIGSIEAKEYDTPVIGIDLGTTYSVVGIYREGKVEIIPNELGARTTPSIISYELKNGKMLVGQAAKNNAAVNPKNTLYDVKRLIGRRYGEILRKDAKLLTYKLANKGGRAYIKTKVNGEDKVQAPEEISAKVLTYLKETAEKYLGETVKYAVITVPAYFNDQQRTATEQAGKIAGLDVLRIVNEPTAAALAYGLNEKEEKNILVFDLGGGTFDVSLLTIDNKIFEVLATSGDTRLGGEDFDQRIVDYFIQKFQKQHGIDIRKDGRAFQKLKHACEQAKRTLSTEFETRIEIDNLVEGKDFSEKLTRAKFEQLNMNLFKKTMIPVQNVLKDSKLKKTDINEVILVGGSTRIPKIRELLKKFFNNRELNLSVNPDEAIAVGACIQGAILDGIIKEAALIDVTPLSLGIETQGGKMSVIIPRNTQIPSVKSEIYTTTVDYQDKLVIPVYEGERPMTRGNRLLGEMELTNIQQAPRGVPQIKVSFSLNQGGILTVSAVDEVTKKENEVTIKKGTLSQDELDRILKDAEENKRQDQILVDRENAFQRLTTLTETINRRMADKKISLRLKASDKKVVLGALREALRFIRKNPDAKKAAIVSQTRSLRKVVKKYLFDNENVAISEDEIFDDDDMEDLVDDDEDEQPIDEDDQPISADDDDDQPIEVDDDKHKDL